MASNGRPLDLGDPCTPMAWQQRDLNYHQSGYQDRYGPGNDNWQCVAYRAVGGGSSRVGPPSTSDRLSHHTDKSWRTHRDSRDSGQPHLVPYGGTQYASGPPPAHYPPSRPSYSSGRPPSNQHSPSSTSSSSSSSTTSEEDSSQQHGDVLPPGPLPPMPHPIYGYTGYPSGPMGVAPGYPGTLKSARSVPALALATWDGEPCPVHGGGPLPGGPMSFPHPHGMPMHPPPQGYPMMPPGPLSLPPPPGSTRRASSIYDMRITSPHPGAIYGTLPVRNIPGDRRSLAGSTILGPAAPGAPPGIPTHLLPPMARPRPLVLGEKGTPEPLPVRNGDKNGSLPPGLSMKAASSVGHSEEDEKKSDGICCRGGACVAWVILAVVCLGILLAVMLRFIL
ncbi:MAGE-like protein 2 isoform X1 [Macrobrachium rosenbergii]|uniref:MAGE-like protein 2 isoform X1 n=1 Tax=Macrobrachium rosenbergii TaxID=79674 RepID=UPI0034D6C48A